MEKEGTSKKEEQKLKTFQHFESKKEKLEFYMEVRKKPETRFEETSREI